MASYLTVVSKMKELYRTKLLKGNEWIDGTDKYGLILTDDLDSLLSCAILKSVKGWNIEQAYIFKGNKPMVKSKDEQLYDYLGEIKNAAQHELIGVDLALTAGKCFDNHLTQFTYEDQINPESINLNRIQQIRRWNYCKKYNLSTVLLLWSLYDLPKENLTDELMMLLLAIDGSYEGFFTDERWVGIHEFWIRDVLDLPEFLECERRHTYREFEEVREKYNIHKGHGKITFKKGMLVTDIDIDEVNETLAWETDIQIELPVEKFYKKAMFKDNIAKINGSPKSIKTYCKNPFSYALTGKYAVNYSEMVEI